MLYISEKSSIFAQFLFIKIKPTKNNHSFKIINYVQRNYQ